jgi:hypothetical protein
MWSKQLHEISKSYFEIDRTHVKSANGNFGILSKGRKNKIYTISIKPDFNVNLTYTSVDEMLKAKWAVD